MVRAGGDKVRKVMGVDYVGRGVRVRIWIFFGVRWVVMLGVMRFVLYV